MTGQEKIQAFIHEIDTAHQELITGNKVRIYSGGLPGTLEEQKQILDILAIEKQAIKYSQSDVYESEDDIDPESRIHILEESIGDGLAERHMIEQLMESQWYEIEVLDNFADLERLPVDEMVAVTSKSPDAIPDYLILQLTPDQYDKRRGVLLLTPFHSIQISKRGTSKRPKAKDGHKEYFECWLMKCVFRSVNTMKDGASFSRITGVHSRLIDKTESKKILNAVTTINKKVTDNRGPKKLLIIQKNRVKINDSYL